MVESAMWRTEETWDIYEIPYIVRNESEHKFSSNIYYIDHFLGHFVTVYNVGKTIVCREWILKIGPCEMHNIAKIWSDKVGDPPHSSG